MSFIYKDIDLSLIELESIGYFKPKKDFETIVPGTNHSYCFNKDKPITKDTLIIYFLGAFSYTHIGHLKLIKEAYESLISDDVRIVISPANSDYLYSKYGSNVNVTNVKRFNRLLNTIEDNKEFLGESYNNLIIDLNPMLNMTCDYNFTDLLKNFIEVSGFNYESLPTPYILCGKDRDIPNGFTDEEYFGTDYDTLSYYTYCKCEGIPSDLTLPLVEQLHKDNYHKYLGQSFNPIFIIDKYRFHIYKNPKFNYHKVT